MSLKRVAVRSLQCFRIGLASLAMFQFTLGAPLADAQSATSNDNNTTSPVKHVIVIIGENRTFDHIFATYKPVTSDTVDNLLSKQIITEEGAPGRNFGSALQFSASDTSADGFEISPMDKSLYSALPPPLTGGPSDVCKDNKICSLADAKASENGLPDDTYYSFLTTGGTSQASKVPDARIINVTSLPPGPFQLTSTTFRYDGYAASPVHRFYQMWQQLDCNAFYATLASPSGCLSDLFPWVEVSVGAGTNGKPQAANFSLSSTGEGSTAMGFYNVLKGDAPYFKFLADNYAMSDNFHQSVMGGTGANHIMLGTGDAIWFSDGNGHPAVPPSNVTVFAGTADAGTVDEIENPDPQAGTNNWYTEDGYGAGGFGSPVSGGGSYTNCSDSDAPGAFAVLDYLSNLPNLIAPRCEPGHYYLLNNYNPGYFGDGSNAYTDTNVNNTPFTIHPSSVRNIGDSLLENNISWKYYGDQWNEYAGNPALNIPEDKYQLNYGTVGAASDQYCNICNFFQYSTSIMTNDAIRTAHLKDTLDFYQDIANGTLPAVSFVKPSGWVDGHPASSKLDLFEGFVKKIVDLVQANQTLWSTTAIFVTFDEGGGYWDSGYVQPLDYFGDGTRIPLIVVSPFTSAGHISHDYGDHVSILKFIERNWQLTPLTNRSRDNFPNPQYDKAVSVYAPINSPAIADLFDLFSFDPPSSGSPTTGSATTSDPAGSRQFGHRERVDRGSLK
jgi:phospholipase C